MTPLINDDLKHIISSIDDRHPKKEELCSLFLFSLFTGCWANSCAHIQMKDLIHIEDKGLGLKTVQIKVRTLKGHDDDFLVFSISGRPFLKTDLSILYWLNLHL